jgi:hypothetical protein
MPATPDAQQDPTAERRTNRSGYPHFDRLSAVSGLSHALLLELAGVLPAELGSVAYQLHAARELRAGLERLKHWVDQAIDISDTPPAAQVASTLLSRSKDWAVSIRPALRGRPPGCRLAPRHRGRAGPGTPRARMRGVERVSG